MKNQGIQLFKGDLIRLYGEIKEVERDNEWNNDFNCWGSVRLVGEYPPVFTHKGEIEIVSRKANTQ